MSAKKKKINLESVMPQDDPTVKVQLAGVGTTGGSGLATIPCLRPAHDQQVGKVGWWGEDATGGSGLATLPCPGPAHDTHGEAQL